MMVVRDNRPLISIVAIILEYRDILLDEEIDRIISRTVGNVEPGPGFPDMSLECARQDAARRRNRRDYEGAEFIERWIRRQERAR